MNGGAGDDTLVWNNGDGTDVIERRRRPRRRRGQRRAGAGDVFTVQPNGARIKFDRTNLVPFSLDIGSSETMHANGLGGDDTITVGDVGSYSVTASGGSGNDTLTGGGSSETFLGGSGNDTINPGGGIDVVSGDEGDDQVNVRDNTRRRGPRRRRQRLGRRRRARARHPRRLRDRRPDAGTRPPVDARAGRHLRRAAVDHRRAGTVKVNGAGAQRRSRSAARRLGQQLHRLARAAHREERQARRAARSSLQLGSARYDLAPGTSRTLKVKLANGHQAPGRPQGPPRGPRGRHDRSRGPDRHEHPRLTLAIHGATKKH